MTFAVTYRDKSGAKAETEIEAASRAECVAECKARGIAPMGIREGRATGRTGVSPVQSTAKGRPKERANRKLFAIRFYLLVAVAALAAIAWWWLAARDDAPSSPPPAEKPKAVRRPEARTSSPRKPPPAASNAQNAVAQPALPKDKRRDIKGNVINVPRNPWGQPIPPELEYKPIWEYTTEDYAKIDPGYLARHEAHKERQASVPWKTDADRQLAILLFAKDGNMGLLTPFNWRFREQFLKSLETPIIATKDDPPELQEQKRQMNEVKLYLKERMDAGEDIVDILNAEYKNAQKIRGLRQNLQDELRKLEKTARSVQEVQDYIDAANKMLDEYGAKHVGLPLVLTRRRLQREAAATQNVNGNGNN